MCVLRVCDRRHTVSFRHLVGLRFEVRSGQVTEGRVFPSWRSRGTDPEDGVRVRSGRRRDGLGEWVHGGVGLGPGTECVAEESLGARVSRGTGEEM